MTAEVRFERSVPNPGQDGQDRIGPFGRDRTIYPGPDCKELATEESRLLGNTVEDVRFSRALHVVFCEVRRTSPLDDVTFE